MRDGKTWYLCDPEKNPECRKRICYQQLGMKCQSVCFMTSRRECAAETENGKALLVIIHRTSRGFVHEIVTE